MDVFEFHDVIILRWSDSIFWRTTLIATWAFALLCDCSMSWNSSTCFFKMCLQEKLLSQIQQMCVLIHFFEDNSYCNLGFYSFVQWFWIVWLFNPMNFFNVFFKTHLLEKPFSQILQFYGSSFSWTELTCFLGSHFCENFDNKLNT